MEIEDIIKRETYRSFELTHLRHGNPPTTRWQIMQKKSGMNQSYGYAASESDARSRVDELLDQTK